MDLCLSCKACKSECPSSVDITKLKAEFLQHYYSEHHYPVKGFTNCQYCKNLINWEVISLHFYNFVNQNPIISKITAQTIGFSPNVNFLY